MTSKFNSHIVVKKRLQKKKKIGFIQMIHSFYTPPNICDVYNMENWYYSCGTNSHRRFSDDPAEIVGDMSTPGFYSGCWAVSNLTVRKFWVGFLRAIGVPNQVGFQTKSSTQAFPRPQIGGWGSIGWAELPARSLNWKYQRHMMWDTHILRGTYCESYTARHIVRGIYLEANSARHIVRDAGHISRGSST